jgi:hypothetical protein
MNKGKDAGDVNRPGNGDISRRGETETRTEGSAQRARGFFERAGERSRTRSTGERSMEHHDRDWGYMRGGRGREEYERERDRERDRDWGQRDREYGERMQGRDQSYGGREPQHYGQEQGRYYGQAYGRSEREGYNMYRGRDQGREYGGYGREYGGYGRDYGRSDYGRSDYGRGEYGRDMGHEYQTRERERDYGRFDRDGRDPREWHERDDREMRGNFGGGYSMTDENSRERSFGRDFGRDDRYGSSMREREREHYGRDWAPHYSGRDRGNRGRW